MLRTWWRLKRAGARLTPNEVFGMWIRGSLSEDLLSAMALAKHERIDVTAGQLEMHALAGGNVRDVVAAEAALRRVGEEPERMRLYALDLHGLPVAKLAAAYLNVRQRHATARFDDLAWRALAGEDVLGSIESGSFELVTESNGWMVRIEKGPFSREVLDYSIAEGMIPAEAWVRAPAGENWLRAYEIRRSSGGHNGG